MCVLRCLTAGGDGSRPGVSRQPVQYDVAAAETADQRRALYVEFQCSFSRRRASSSLSSSSAVHRTQTASQQDHVQPGTGLSLTDGFLLRWQTTLIDQSTTACHLSTLAACLSWCRLECYVTTSTHKTTPAERGITIYSWLSLLHSYNQL